MSVTKAFLRVHWDQKKPLLLAYSGGSDSKALLYALLEIGIKPHLAHVDHGWREESQEEALALQKEAELLGCPFFTKRLLLKTKSEDEARKKRYQFLFQQASSYAALLLAHHLDDLVETVLKRVFEGAHLFRLAGMQKVSFQEGVPLWRPFLDLQKADLLEFLNERSLNFSEDSSNLDLSYLRSRMRQEIFPFLKENFGKEMRPNLSLLSQRSSELEQYLERKIKHVEIQEKEGVITVDLAGLDPFERRFLLCKIGSIYSFPLRRSQIQTLLQWVESMKRSKEIWIQSKKILVHRGLVSFFLNPQCSQS